MRGLETYAARIGARRADRLRGRVAGALRAELGDGVREEGEMVTIEGSRAVARIWAEPALRWIAGLVR